MFPQSGRPDGLVHSGIREVLHCQQQHLTRHPAPAQGLPPAAAAPTQGTAGVPRSPDSSSKDTWPGKGKPHADSVTVTGRDEQQESASGICSRSPRVAFREIFGTGGLTGDGKGRRGRNFQWVAGF